MEWYYEKDGTQQGPVSEDALKRLFVSQSIRGGNLVWCQGMKDWATYESMFLKSVKISGAHTKIGCPTCGAKVESDALISAGDSKVCPNCCDEYFQLLNKGALESVDSGSEVIRQEYIKHEASLRSIGTLYLLSAMSMIVSLLIVVPGLARSSVGIVAIAITLVVYGCLTALFVGIYLGFRKLNSWVRIPTTLFSIVGLLGIPFGTLINGYVLYLIWSQKGRAVFTDEYRDIITATPHIKYKTSVLVWIFLAIIIFGLLAAMLIPELASIKEE